LKYLAIGKTNLDDVPIAEQLVASRSTGNRSMREVIKNDCSSLFAYDENMRGSGSDLCHRSKK